jgi:hypothetical protein
MEYTNGITKPTYPRIFLFWLNLVLLLLPAMVSWEATSRRAPMVSDDSLKIASLANFLVVLVIC